MGICMWCHGRGWMSVDRGSSLRYDCTGCGGSGYIPECEECGREYYDEYCERCYAECEECGSVELKCELNHKLCAGCYEELQQ